MNPSPGLKIGSIRGVPVYIGRTWPLVALLIVVGFGPTVANSHADWGFGAYLIALAYALLLLISVLVHEAAHALTGQACGYSVNRIVADLIGGHTAYDTENATPGRSALVAVVGPLSNLALAGLGWFGLQQAADGEAAHLLLVAFTFSNLFVGLFNLLPGLPLDGGFLVDALVWKATGNRAAGLKAAGWCGRLVALLVVVWALWPVLSGDGEASIWTMAWTLFIAMFLWRGASTAVTVGHNRQFLSGIVVADVLRPAHVVWGTTPLADVPDTNTPTVLLDPHGHIESILLPDAHVAVPLERRRTLPASALGHAVPVGATASIDNVDSDITAILPGFEGEVPPNFIVVTQPGADDVQIVGTIARSDVERAMITRAHALRQGER